jgi:hypothetical protein
VAASEQNCSLKDNSREAISKDLRKQTAAQSWVAQGPVFEYTRFEQIVAPTLVETTSGKVLWGVGMRTFALALLMQALLWGTASARDYRITRDFGGYIDEYKAKFTAIRDRGDRVIIDGACDSACTLVLGIVPLSHICVTPRARLGFHMAYNDQLAPNGTKILSEEATADMMSYYPESVKLWLSRHGGLTPDLKKLRNGPELWEIVDPCPGAFF